jgi:hypothetical protein
MKIILEAANPKNADVNDVLRHALCNNGAQYAITILSAHTWLKDFTSRTGKTSSESAHIVSPTGNRVYLLANNEFGYFHVDNFDEYTLVVNGRKLRGATKNSDIDLYSMLMSRDREKDDEARELANLIPSERQKRKYEQQHTSIAPSIAEYKEMQKRLDEETEWKKNKIDSQRNDVSLEDSMRRYSNEVAALIQFMYTQTKLKYKRNMILIDRKAELQSKQPIYNFEVIDLNIDIGFDHMSLVGCATDMTVVLITILDYSRIFNYPAYGVIACTSDYDSTAATGNIQVVSRMLDELHKTGYISTDALLTLMRYIASTTKTNKKRLDGFSAERMK